MRLIYDRRYSIWGQRKTQSVLPILTVELNYYLSISIRVFHFLCSFFLEGGKKRNFFLLYFPRFIVSPQQDLACASLSVCMVLDEYVIVNMYHSFRLDLILPDLIVCFSIRPVSSLTSQDCVTFSSFGNRRHGCRRFFISSKILQNGNTFVRVVECCDRYYFTMFHLQRHITHIRYHQCGIECGWSAAANWVNIKRIYSNRRYTRIIELDMSQRG